MLNFSQEEIRSLGAENKQQGFADFNPQTMECPDHIANRILEYRAKKLGYTRPVDDKLQDRIQAASLF
jgi:hypothetical protein